MKVLFTTCFPSPYRVDFYNELGKHCELTVLSEENTKDQKHRNAKWLDSDPENFKLYYLKQKRIFRKVVCFEALEFILKKQFDIIVVGGCSTFTEIMLILFLSLKKIPFAISSDGGMVKTENYFKFNVKKILISKATFWLCTGKYSKEYFVHYGADEEKVYIYPFTSLRKEDMPKLDEILKEKKQVKDLLGLKEQTIVITVGQFIHRKANDVLMKACTELDKSVGVYIIGGKATDEYIYMRKALNLDEKVHFLDFKSRDELKLYYNAADIFVLPTREDIWGLVINEAMAHGLPIITTDRCIAGLELINNGENGYIVPVEDNHDIAEKINILANNNSLRLNMATNNYKKISNYTIEKMAKMHMDIFETVINERDKI